MSIAHDEPRKKSLELLRFWYQCRCNAGSQRYHPSGDEMTVTPSTKRDNPTPNRQPAKTLTANGTEKRVLDEELKGSMPTGESTDPFAKYGPLKSQKRSAYETFSRCALQHVSDASPIWHQTLEMRCANYTDGRIAAELECSIRKVDMYFECGLASITSYRIQNKPSWRDGCLK